MGRVSEKNSCFRTKRQICEDITFVLNAPMSWGSQHAVIAQALWVWSEFDGKYHGCRYWSQSAWSNRQTIKGLRHDHAVPKKLLIGRMKELRTVATVELVQDVLERNCIGVVVTLDEDRLLSRSGLQASMPPNSDDDPFSRYRAAGITIRQADSDSAI
jgi:hypothetical protein